MGILDGEILRWSLKALLCGRGDEWRRFDALFDAYFLPPNRAAFAEDRAATLGQPEAAGRVGDANQPLPVAVARGDARSEDDGGAERHGVSREESLASTDFRDLDRPDRVRDIEVLMRRFARRLKHLQLRREARFDRGRRLDLQGTIRRSVGCLSAFASWNEAADASSLIFGSGG